MEKQKNQEIKEEEIFRNLLDNFPLSIFLLESSKKIYDCNSVAELYLNQSKTELINKNFFDIFSTSSTHNQESLDEMIYNIINFDLNEIAEFEFINHKGNRAWVQGFFSSVKFGNEKLIQIILQDITERKLADNIIKEENKRLRELNQMKKQMTVDTSEKLKNPLAIMSNASQILLNSYKDKLDQNAIQLLELIKNGGEKSVALVGRIVDISRIESQEFDLNKQTESLLEILRHCADEIMSKMKKHDFTFNFNVLEDLYSEVDRIRIEQVINDLLLNAIKNTPKNGIISIDLQRNNNYVDISITHTGIGLKKRKKKKVFSSKTTINSQESLLGLHFSKEIIELHGGQIIVEPESKDKGSTYIIRLPIKNWTDLLIHVYIIYKYGVLLYDHSFEEKTKTHDSVLISGGIIGMITLLKEIMHGKTRIRTIDHGDRKLMFETNETDDVIFVLLVKETLIVFERRLNSLIAHFDASYKDLIDDIENTSMCLDDWENLGDLINEYFRK